MKALVTGASSGLGRDIARVLAARGCKLILTARSRDKLEAVASYLLEHETMEQEEFLAVFGETPKPLPESAR